MLAAMKDQCKQHLYSRAMRCYCTRATKHPQRFPPLQCNSITTKVVVGHPCDLMMLLISHQFRRLEVSLSLERPAAQKIKQHFHLCFIRNKNVVYYLSIDVADGNIALV